MNLAQLYYFRKLAQLQHYTKAAKELYITQPSLSDSIASLEQELGIALFQKEGRNIKLTKHGSEFYQYVCASLNELEKGIEAAKEKSGVIGGVIDIACIPTLCGDFLPKSINGYLRARNPHAKFNVFQAMSLAIIEGIKTAKYDIGFCSMVEGEADLTFLPILAQELAVIVNQEHPLAQNMDHALTFNDLKPHKIVTYRQNIPIGKIVSRILSEHDLTASYLFDDEISIGGYVSDNPVAAIAANTPFLRQFDNLVYHKLDVRADTRLVYMVYSKKNPMTKALESYLDYVLNNEVKIPN